MPDLSTFSSLLGAVSTIGRFAVILYAALATTLTTACLTLHAITTLDRRLAGRRAPGPSGRRIASRSLFLQLEAEPE
jgi:hypothetical protein